MTHRVALVLSIVLTLAVSAGVFAGRDRLFAPENAASSSAVTSSAAQSPGDGQAGQLTRTVPRIVTVPLPPTLTTSGGATEARAERGEGSFDHERDDHEDNERSNHDEEHDDD
ncbi:MAG: hypothetical protein U0Z70_16925 [Thermomicrobiales bacterium]|nr:hypothetical protein [Chloroflexia bacterium]